MVVHFPNKPMVFPTRNFGHFGVWIGGIPPFKETPIIWCFWEGYISSSLLYGITSRLTNDYIVKLPTLNGCRGGWLSMRYFRLEKTGFRRCVTPKRRAEAEGPVKDSTLRRQNWQFSQGNIYTPGNYSKKPKMEVDGRWCSFSIGWFLGSIYEFSRGVSKCQMTWVQVAKPALESVKFSICFQATWSPHIRNTFLPCTRLAFWVVKYDSFGPAKMILCTSMYWDVYGNLVNGLKRPYKWL